MSQYHTRKALTDNVFMALPKKISHCMHAVERKSEREILNLVKSKNWVDTSVSSVPLIVHPVNENVHARRSGALLMQASINKLKIK